MTIISIFFKILISFIKLTSCFIRILIKNVQNPVEFYKDFIPSNGNTSWSWKCKNQRCGVRFPFWGQEKFNQMFDNDLMEKSQFKFKLKNGKKAGFLDWFKSDYHKEYNQAYIKHYKVYPQKLTGTVYSKKCKRCRMVSKFKDVVVEGGDGAGMISAG